MSDLAKSLKGEEKQAPSTRLASILASLERYGDGSIASLEKMRGDVQGAVASAPPWLDEAAGEASRLLPGVGALDSMRMGSEAGGMWREGRYADSLDRYADALHAPINEVFWFTPGGGIVKKVAR